MSTELPVKDKSGGRTVIKISPFKSAIRHTDPHRHNGYFELIYLTAGEGVHVIDGRRYSVQPPVLFVIRRDQVHCWELSAPGHGYVLIVRREFVDGLTDGRLRSMFASISAHNCLLLEPSATVDRLWEVLLDELGPAKDEVPELSEWALKTLLGKMIEVAAPGPKQMRETGGLYDSFMHLLGDGHAIKRTVSHYANLLHTTPQNLNNACRKAADRSATEVLGEFLMVEARRLLLYTNGTVAEISFALDFKDPSHFVKYFKRATGRTPQAFRKE
ncbi:MAG: helix-turn-helix domain-containing protein [Bacteroidetes bacterium]|nr:helix-turn-helix domain-containing protein [Bacteroidota bacterium]